MRWLLALAALAAPHAAAAQVTYPPANPAAAGQAAQAASDAAAAKTAADAAKATADAAATAAAAACMPMAVVPPSETVGGTTGSGRDCRLVNAAQPRITRTGLFTVGAGGNIVCSGSTTCVWRDAAGNLAPLPAGASSYPMFFTAVGTSSLPSIRCKVLSSTNTGFSAQCTQSAATVSILGASVELLASSGTQVYALALPATQANQ